MEDGPRGDYWCYICSQMVHPVMEGEIKCPQCQTGFVEEMRPSNNNNNNNNNNNFIDLGSLAASMLVGLLGSLAPSRPQITADNSSIVEDELMRREIESLLGRRRNNLSGPNPGVFEDESDNVVIDSGRERRRPRVVVFNNEAGLMVHGSFGEPAGVDLLLQHLAENGSAGRYGSPPAHKEAVKALPKVCVGDNSSQCSVCLEDFPVGSEALEMPCKHNFHAHCILPWLDLHCSCPVCRTELPSDTTTQHNLQRRVPSWSFQGMLTLMGPQNVDNNSTTEQPPSPETVTEHPNHN